MKIKKISRTSYAQIVKHNDETAAVLKRLAETFQAWGMTDARIKTDEKRFRVEMRQRRLYERTVEMVVPTHELMDLLPVVVQ
ncbi:MAG TPA: hypothetical protein PKM65_20425 [Spirochaetota bacterium]|nr:hypothetical protein [Spirochaetota bacterium]